MGKSPINYPSIEAGHSVPWDVAPSAQLSGPFYLWRRTSVRYCRKRSCLFLRCRFSVLWGPSFISGASCWGYLFLTHPAATDSIPFTCLTGWCYAYFCGTPAPVPAACLVAATFLSKWLERKGSHVYSRWPASATSSSIPTAYWKCFWGWVRPNLTLI